MTGAAFDFANFVVNVFEAADVSWDGYPFFVDISSCRGLIGFVSTLMVIWGAIVIIN